MLPGERSLPEAIVAPDGQTVNRLFDWLCRQADQTLAVRFEVLLQQVQNRWFDRQRGRLRCPDCASHHLIRKGWRPRVVTTSRGRLRLKVLQAHCKSCRRTFRPLNAALGLPTSRRLLEELAAKAVYLGVQVSFARSAGILRRLTGGSLSAEGLRQVLARQAAELALPKPQPGQTVLVDATKVKAGAKERGAPVYLAVTAAPGPLKNHRPTCRKRLVHLHVGDSRQLKKRLRAFGATRVVHDGGEDLTGCAAALQRCRWHLGHQLKHYLWQDGVPHGFRNAFRDTTTRILSDRDHGSTRYRRWQINLAALGLTTAANHLQRATDEAFTYLKDPFDYIDTSPLEREMRELNRRADVGVRWSPQGLENVLKLLFHYRLNEPSKGMT